MSDSDYYSDVRCRVREILTGGTSTFGQAIAALEGMDPSLVMTVAEELRNEDRSLPQFAEPSSTPAYVVQKYAVDLPPPHPLDYEWRYSDASIGYLLNICHNRSGADGTSVLLGAPSLLRAGIERKYPGILLLIDGNSRSITSLIPHCGPHRAYHCDLFHDVLPEVSGNVVVADPPWYPEHMRAFTWAASRMCEVGGLFLLSLPPIGTRPGIAEERTALYGWMDNCGFSLMEVRPGVLSYMSPQFEINSLAASGLAVPEDWRCGDLALFELRERTVALRPEPPQDDAWLETVIQGVGIRVRQVKGNVPGNPRLVPIVEGDVLPSVSRRDERRKLVDVWTSGNRVFSCGDPCGLRTILQAIADSVSPLDSFERYAGRPCSPDEVEAVSQTIEKVTEIIRIETNENDRTKTSGCTRVAE